LESEKLLQWEEKNTIFVLIW